MKKAIILIFLLLPAYSWGQVKLDFISSVDFTDRLVTNYGDYESYRKSEIGKFNYHLGINYNQRCFKNIWFKMGVGFARLGYQSETISYFMHHPILTDDGNRYVRLEVADKYRVSHHFLTVPIGLRIEFPTEKITPFIELGLSNMIYLESSSVVNSSGNDKKRKGRLPEINPFQFALNVSFGGAFPIGEKWEMLVRPNFNFHLTNKFNNILLIKEHLFSVGLSFGVCKKLS